MINNYVEKLSSGAGGGDAQSALRPRRCALLGASKQKKTRTLVLAFIIFAPDALYALSLECNLLAPDWHIDTLALEFLALVDAVGV